MSWTNPIKSLFGIAEKEYSELELTEINPLTGELEDLTLGEFEEMENVGWALNRFGRSHKMWPISATTTKR